MNLNEFKAFVEGIEHAFGNEAPSPEQWQVIKDKLHQVDQETPVRRLDDLRVPTNPWFNPGTITSQITKPLSAKFEGGV